MCKAKTDRGKKEKPSKGKSSAFDTGDELDTGLDRERWEEKISRVVHLH